MTQVALDVQHFWQRATSDFLDETHKLFSLEVELLLWGKAAPS